MKHNYYGKSFSDDAGQSGHYYCKQFRNGEVDKNDVYYAFIDGAEWAKKYLIERVCNELEIMEGKEVAECYRKLMEE